jgi:hypothetical protein
MRRGDDSRGGFDRTAGESHRTMPRDAALDPEWPTILWQFKHSGLTHAEFCRRRRLPLHTFWKQLYRHRAARRQAGPVVQGSAIGRPTAMPSPPFIPVTIIPATNDDARSGADPVSSPVELVLPRGRRIAVGPGFDFRTVLQLVELFEGRPSRPLTSPRTG